MIQFIFILTFSLFSTSLFAFEFRGNVRTIWAGDTHNDNDVEHLVENDTRIFAEGHQAWEKWSVTGSLLARYTLALPENTYQQFEANLYEAYLCWASGPWLVEGGERVVRWGVMEYVSPTDAINPRDVRHLIDPEVEDTYLPVPLLRLIYDRKPFVAEAIYQPFFRRSEFDVAETDNSLLQPSFFSLLGLPYPTALSQVDDKTAQQLPGIIAPLPDDNPLTGEGGVRLGWSHDQTDVELLFLTKRETFPAFDIPGGVSGIGGITTPGTTSGSYPRNEMAGATARWVFDNGVTLKGEALFQPNISVYNNLLFRYREADLQWAAGVDYDWELKHLFTIEYAQDRVMSGNIVNYFLRDEVQHTVSAAAIFNFDANTWTIELKGTSIVNQHAYLIRPRLLYRPIPSWEFGLGGNAWGGKANSLFGLLDANDQIFASAKYLF